MLSHGAMDFSNFIKKEAEAEIVETEEVVEEPVEEVAEAAPVEKTAAPEVAQPGQDDLMKIASMAILENAPEGGLELLAEVMVASVAEGLAKEAEEPQQQQQAGAEKPRDEIRESAVRLGTQAGRAMAAGTRALQNYGQGKAKTGLGKHTRKAVQYVVGKKPGILSPRRYFHRGMGGKAGGGLAGTAVDLGRVYNAYAAKNDRPAQ
jgi:hypothetical protein